MSVDDNGPALIIHRLKKLGFNVQITPSPGLIEILFLSSLGKSPATRNGSLARYKDGTAGWQPHLDFAHDLCGLLQPVLGCELLPDLKSDGVGIDLIDSGGIEYLSCLFTAFYVTTDGLLYGHSQRDLECKRTP
jgi:hypothetical protein